MSKRYASVIAVALLVAASVAMGQEPDTKVKELKLGDPAPKLEVSEFVKGEPVKSLQKGTIYVVEFWATWCGPCRVTIPHLTELQKKHKNVKFVGVSILEQDPSLIKPFVEKMGDEMVYSVAVDSVPKDADGSEGKMAKNWMSAAGENGIPAAFIINKDGNIAWIGHPAEMDKPLDEIVEGKYDMKAAVAKRQEAKAEQQKIIEIQKKLAQAQQVGVKELLKAIDEIIAENPSLEEGFNGMKFMALMDKDGDPDKAVVFGTKLITGAFKDNPEALNLIAWTIVDPAGGKRTEKQVKLALTAAMRADELAKGSNSAIADTLAKAYFDSGNASKALETQERSIKLLEKEDAEPNQAAEMKERLEQYRKAAKK